MEPTITPRQMEILTYIRDFRREHGFSPTLQEMGDALGLTKVTVFEHVGALERKGLLKRGAKHSARSLKISSKVTFPDERPTRLPLAGRIVAGLPIEAVQDVTVLDLDELLDCPGQTFALQVVGDSMIGDHICDGDYVICERRTTVRNGETVVALLPDGEATLKRFYRERGRVRLQPANEAFEPIFLKEVQIQGVVIGLLRTM
ncbi:MAG: transcriptional repressor LexA [Planctomycetes bacterium]|nr:transcriptional repressor LexA [Planctomycetota bacterium]